MAHLIVGAKAEPFLPSMLASVDPAVDHLFVNENSGLGTDAPALPALQSSAFAQSGRMSMVRTTFTTFEDARNACFDLDTAADTDTWIAFIDADEVHGERVAKIRSKLGSLPQAVGFVDGYTWHFFKTYDRYLSIERRMMFFRWSPAARWKGRVHEQLTGVPGKRVALPYVYAHYGHVVPFAQTARREAQYAALGAAGTLLSVQDAHAADFHADYDAAERVFSEWWRKCMRFDGKHPAAALAFIEQDRRENASYFRDMERLIVKHQPPVQRARNAIMKLNYEQRWRLRAIEAARYGFFR
ncbi:MAG: hypothetical protein M3126_00495 [Candidatus Eremiobacteraeota bacterium]|nr:hypothetical protein [Candidatus Eremiobacteraeota bacterium]